jgi:hypothetical protein
MEVPAGTPAVIQAVAVALEGIQEMAVLEGSALHKVAIRGQAAAAAVARLKVRGIPLAAEAELACLVRVQMAPGVQVAAHNLAVAVAGERMGRVKLAEHTVVVQRQWPTVVLAQFVLSGPATQEHSHQHA